MAPSLQVGKSRVKSGPYVHLIFEPTSMDGVAMGSPLGPSMANLFMCALEKFLDDCPSQCKPIIYRRFADDIFCLFTNEEHVNLFLDLIKSHNYCKLSIRRDRDEINELLSEFVQIYTNWYMIPFNMLMCIR